jgi:hypothetical protein
MGVRFEASTAVTVELVICGVEVPCGLVSGYQIVAEDIACSFRC